MPRKKRKVRKRGFFFAPFAFFVLSWSYVYLFSTRFNHWPV
jgi:hypothetical protein